MIPCKDVVQSIYRWAGERPYWEIPNVAVIIILIFSSVLLNSFYQVVDVHIFRRFTQKIEFSFIVNSFELCGRQGKLGNQ